ncbi:MULTISPECIES: ectoine/hydroxyectoine ABC transporter permease subunit EhuC [unclassified Streptomyces]|uniref:Ectoine/hydroxyectoine ABC transporter permease subunit EhuC n=1 Tax=Streptomyces evansiae TaxID=3075535 RepID=A0ABU2QXV7_9ACTN|nr:MULTISPECIES: ectoine/hydroxyectoine ABC transporter permease subunit EhuC [unclassified Streptomyces]MDT0409271.1 ectoine/hydroxyectoine ABC transporter permease subunit EhuC [Streptomyces sp. DSM 41979]MYQ59483.1 ectoine/hydroxyectoine ABC transporter permease subunit EhuC [Streptomyces sp. SID4926]NJA58395.1 ectoine/hydroxyectoine ABC transporter permease subunit EhuC [Streptomyces sp. NEAU-H3]WEH29528.1 ectoine/hydroxyectoine ABC transporter permease subunit EhuC [Streptomyces sp. AM 3-1
MGDFFSLFFDSLDDVGSGLWVTVQATVLGALVAFALSFVFGFMANSAYLLVRGISRVIVEFFRGTSLYVQVFWLFYALPLLTGYQLDPLFCGVVAFGINYGAYGSEVVRGALNAVPRAQFEAAVALNFSPVQRMRKVILPQAWVQMIPSFTSLLIMLLKATPLLWLITAVDITAVVQQMRDRTGATAPAYLTLLVIYFVLAYLLTLGMNALERAAKKRLGQHESARGVLRSRSAEPALAGGGAK